MIDPDNNQEIAGVLFVDDEKNILRSLQRLMVDEDYPVFTANSGGEGLEILRANPEIGLIVSDQRMPEMNGAEFLFRSREIAPEALRILLTGYSDIEATIDAINRGGAYRYVTKPWNDEDLLQTIRDGLKNYLLIRENKRLAAIVQQQNEELKEWNGRLKTRVLKQTTEIREKNHELHRKNKNLSKVYQNMIVAFSGLIELYSKALRNHSANVAELSRQVANAMNLPGEEAEDIYVAARLHDIGELGTPEGLLNKPLNKMEPTKLQQYMQHAVRGQTAIDAIEELRPVGLLIRHHHERFDGKGFPDRLQGEEIPLGARIIAIADYADRTRQFTEEPNVAKVILPRLEKLLGSHFDPALYSYFQGPIEELYGHNQPPAQQAGRMVQARDLKEGMILGQDLISGTGLLLLNRGTCLDSDRIASILRYDKLDPFEKGITILDED